MAIDEVIDKKVDALMSMESQFVEGGAERLAAQGRGRARGPPQARSPKASAAASPTRPTSYRDKLIELYGEEQGKKVRYAEAFEICEYGRRPNAEELRRLFPFFPKK